MVSTFDNILLPSYVITELYKEDLVIVPGESQPNVNPAAAAQKIPVTETIAAPAKPEYLGNNNRRVLVLVNDDAAKYVNDEDLEQLTKILAACKLNLADIAIVNCIAGNIQYAALQPLLEPEKVILFAVDPVKVGLPFTMPQYQVQKYGGSTFLYAASLTYMRSNSEEKRKLWESLKKVFGL